MKESNIFQRTLNGMQDFLKSKETKEDSIYPMEIVFKGFKASKKPFRIPPKCLPCGSRLVWKPDRYSFTGASPITVTVPEIGWWKCPKGHPGEIYGPDLKRYISLGKKIEQILKTKNPAISRD